MTIDITVHFDPHFDGNSACGIKEKTHSTMFATSNLNMVTCQKCLTTIDMYPDKTPSEEN